MGWTLNTLLLALFVPSFLSRSSESSDMAFQNHRPSFDITSIEMQSPPRQPSPAPTYSSTFHSNKDSSLAPQHPYGSSSSSAAYWPDEKINDPYATTKMVPNHITSSNNPYLHSENTKRNARDETTTRMTEDPDRRGEDFEVKAEPHDTNHPLYVGPSSSNHYEPPRSTRQHRLPRKRVLIPWLLALTFLLLAIWSTSIALGAKLLADLHPMPPDLAPPEVNVIINHAGTDNIPSVTIRTTISSETQSSTTSRRGGLQTQEPDAAPVPGDDPDDNTGNNTLLTRVPNPRQNKATPTPTSFITIIRSAE